MNIGGTAKDTAYMSKEELTEEMTIAELLSVTFSNWIDGHPHQRYVLTIKDARDPVEELPAATLSAGAHNPTIA